MSPWITTALALIGSFMGVFVLFKYVLLMEVRLDAKTFKALYEIIKGGRTVESALGRVTENAQQDELMRAYEEYHKEARQQK